MSTGRVPFVVCVSSDATVRQRVVRRLDDVGPVMLCADLAELRAMLFAVPDGADGPGVALPAASWDEELPAVGLPAVGSPAGGSPATVPPEASAGSVALVLGDLSVDPDGHMVTWRGAPLAVTRLERQLLARLVSPPVRVWTYERLFGSVWGGAYLGDTAILHSAVKRLRRKLRGLDGGPQVQTVRGVGYRLALDG